MISSTRNILFLLILGSTAAAQHTNHLIEEKAIGEFKLSIYLPPGYDRNEHYKTLYFNDGQTIFGPSGLNVDGTADELIEKKMIEPIIVVGIHSDQNRTSNYVPYADKGAAADFGAYTPSADKYSEKIIGQIIPFIEKNYSVKTERGIAGYSFGGLHSTWIALNYPDLFAFSGSLSPSYWVNNFKIFEEATKAKKSQIFYFDIGTGEWDYIVPMLLHSQLPMLKNIFYFEDFGGRHILSDWRGDRIKNILLLFAGKTDFGKYTWDLTQEIIRSEYTGKFYPRINPVIHYSNGLTCSVSYSATFTVMNPDAGVVNKDGSFRFTEKKDIHLTVTYNQEEKPFLINYKEVEKIKAKLSDIAR